MPVTFRSFWNVWHARTAGYTVTTVNMLLVSCCETSRCQLRRQWDEAFGRYMRYKLAGCNYDLYEKEFRKLNEKEEKLKFLMIEYPGAQIVPYGADKQLPLCSQVCAGHDCPRQPRRFESSQ